MKCPFQGQYINIKLCCCLLVSLLGLNGVCLCLMRQARLQRGNIKLKQGKLDDAKVDFEHIVSLMQIIYTVIIFGFQTDLKYIQL